jgi:gluconate 2-dehydrogenase gamma chain
MVMPVSTRRQLLSATALVVLSSSAIAAEITPGRLPWQPNEAYPPDRVRPGGWHFLTAPEVATVDAIVERLIPADDLSPSGKDAGCTVFIDRQLAGPFGSYEWLYMSGPFAEKPLPFQGIQSPMVPRDQYRNGLAALNTYCVAQFAGKRFEQLDSTERDNVLKAMEKGELELGRFKAPLFDARMFFALLLQNTMEGFFADPIYGGNRDMAGWKMVGFPGTRYDYRDVLDNPGKRYTKPPTSIIGRADWNGKPA